MARKSREGSLGDAMEQADVELQTSAAKNCRTPGDYKLWEIIGREAVSIARKMTQEQRSVFVVAAVQALQSAKDTAMSNASGRLQAVLGFNKVPEHLRGFDDDDS